VRGVLFTGAAGEACLNCDSGSSDWNPAPRGLLPQWSASCEVQAMPYQYNNDIDRRNDMKLLTPLLVMALIAAAGFLYYAVSGHAPPTNG
jgi:hypothetical protein